MQKKVELKKYNIRIAKLLDVILNMNEEQQQTILQHAEDLVRGDRRFSNRKSCDLPANFATTDRTHKGYIKNISNQGVFIESRAPIIIGEAVLMVFKVNRDSKAVKLKGEIAHATRWGIGVEFTAKGARFDQQIKNLIQQIR
mgnify:CR=1 FL=1